MPEPFQLVLMFTNINSSEIAILTIPDGSEEGYMGSEILTSVDNSVLPYPVFTVRVAMMISSVVGDFSSESRILGMPPNILMGSTCMCSKFSNTYIH